MRSRQFFFVCLLEFLLEAKPYANHIASLNDHQVQTCSHLLNIKAVTGKIVYLGIKYSN